MRAIAEVVHALIQGVQEGTDVDLNVLKNQVSGGEGRQGGLGGFRVCTSVYMIEYKCI